MVLYRFLLLVGVLHVLAGLGFALGWPMPILAGYRTFLLQHFQLADLPQATRFANSVGQLFGATVASWGMLFIVTLKVYRETHLEMAKYGALGAVLLWFCLDSAISAYYGLWLHLLINVPVVALCGACLFLWQERPEAPSSVNSIAASIAGKRILITGGTGFIGVALVQELLRLGCEITILTRNAFNLQKTGLPVRWITSLEQLPQSTRLDGLINLAGESLAQGRWSERKKQRLWSSRIQTTTKLLSWMQTLQVPPQFLLNASAIGFYGPQGDEAITEDSAFNRSFSHDLCAAWERQADQFAAAGLVVIKLRLGVVLAKQGGAFTQIRQPLKWRVATVLGTGSPYFSWVHRVDVIRAVVFLIANINNKDLQGPINITAPDAVSYAQLAQSLARHAKAWAIIRVPPWCLRLLLGQMAEELLLTGQNVKPRKLLDAGFVFEYPNLDAALDNLLKGDV